VNGIVRFGGLTIFLIIVSELTIQCVKAIYINRVLTHHTSFKLFAEMIGTKKFKNPKSHSQVQIKSSFKNKKEKVKTKIKGSF
jgi:hypothetical protein